MRVISALSVLVLSIVLLAGHAHSDGQKSESRAGEIRSASITLPVSSSGVLFVVPADRFYLLTQACIDQGLVAQTLSGSEFGVLVTDGGCTEYTPGIVFEPGEVITNTTGVPPFPVPDDLTVSANITGFLVDPKDKND